MSGTVRARWNGASRSSSARTDVETLSAEQVVDGDARGAPPGGGARVLVPEGGERSSSTCCSSGSRSARVFALDTHVLFPETYALWRELEQRYGIRIEVFEGPSLGRQAAVHGDALWERNPDLCCSIRKLGPLGEALSGLSGWITGVRRDQAPSRADDGQARLGRAPRALEGEPARRLDGRRRLGLRPRARPPRQPAPRARLRFDRLHALHRRRARAAMAGGRAPARRECGLHA